VPLVELSTILTKLILIVYGIHGWDFFMSGTEPYVPGFENLTRPHFFWFVVIKHGVSLFKQLYATK